jgi:hypothetical protein
MNEEEQAQLRRLEVDRERLARSLTKAGKEDGAEIAYANSVRRIVEFHQAHGDQGFLGVRRTRYLIGTS